MLIYASTACLPGPAPLAKRIDAYVNAGLSHIELGAGVDVDDNALEQLDTSLQFLIHNYFPPPAEPFVLNLASPSLQVRQQSLDLVFQALQLTAQLGAPFYSVHAGFITDPTSFGKTSFIFPLPESPEAALEATERFLASLNTILDYAEKLGVMVLVENNVCTEDLRDRLLLQTADEFLALFDRITHNNVGILLDTGHLRVSAHTFGFDPIDFVNQTAPYVRAFHIHDNDGTADQHRVIAPDGWVMDVLRRPAFASLSVVVESKFENAETLACHIRWLEEHLRSCDPSDTVAG